MKIYPTLMKILIMPYLIVMKWVLHGDIILNIDLNNINLDDTNYEEYDPDTIIHFLLYTFQTHFGMITRLFQNVVLRIKLLFSL